MDFHFIIIILVAYRNLAIDWEDLVLEAFIYPRLVDCFVTLLGYWLNKQNKK